MAIKQRLCGRKNSFNDSANMFMVTNIRLIICRMSYMVEEM